MKKKLEAELISIAHRILQMKNKSDLAQLQQEALKLYEKLSVLRFVEDNFADIKPTIGYAAVEDKLTEVFDNDAVVETPAAVETESDEEKDEAINEIISGIAEKANEQAQAEPEVEIEAEEKQAEAVDSKDESVAELDSPEETIAPVEAEATAEANEEDSSTNEEEKIEEPTEQKEPESKQDDLFKPAFEWGFEAKEEPKEEAKITPAQISFDDLLGQSYKDPIFVKPEEMETDMSQQVKSEEQIKPQSTPEINEPNENVIPISRNFNDTSNVISINKSENLNDRISKGITIGLNDRIAFMKHLFNNSSEDYNRVLSQLITFDTLPEAKNFIDTMVKPDYNNWDGKDEYEQRFMEIVEKKFS